MKVEKCPRCGKDPRVFKLRYTDANRKKYTIHHGCAGSSDWYEEGSRFILIAKLKFNRWARREARRIAKEGKGK